MTPEKLFAQALALVESERIRTWANSDHNRPVWIRFIERNKIDVNGLAALIVGTAIGL